MKVDELIKEYEKAKKTKKEYDFSKRIKMQYMPYSQKCSLAKNIVANTSYVEVEGKSLYKRNTASMLFLFTMQLIANYTDIEIESKDVVEAYDLLVESGLMDELLSAIPDSETKILKGLLDFERDDLECNTRSLVSFLETKFESMDIAMTSLLNVLDRPEIKAKIEEFKK